MTVLEWFALGAGLAGAAYVWHRIARSMMWDESFFGTSPPHVCFGVICGFFGILLAPVWVPCVLAVKAYDRFPIRATVLRAFPDPNGNPRERSMDLPPSLQALVDKGSITPEEALEDLRRA